MEQKLSVCVAIVIHFYAKRIEFISISSLKGKWVIYLGKVISPQYSFSSHAGGFRPITRSSLADGVSAVVIELW